MSTRSRSGRGGGRGGGVGGLLRRTGSALAEHRRNRAGSGRGGGAGGHGGSASKTGPRGAVGTEALALKNIERNGRNFGYPKEGFETKIEHSLLYAMITEAVVYPPEVVNAHVDDEDFTQYLYVADEHGAGLAASGWGFHKDGSASVSGENGDGAAAAAAAASGNSQGVAENEAAEPRVSYAQLSAILALSAEKVPPQTATAGGGGTGTGTSDSTGGENKKDDVGVPQKLCKAAMRTVIKYATQHDPPLDREAELRELLDPVRRHSLKRGNKAALKQILPFYVGYAATLLTLNPLPMLAGLAATQTMEATDGSREEEVNVRMMKNEGSRMGDVEKVGLLDEAEDDF